MARQISDPGGQDGSSRHPICCEQPGSGGRRPNYQSENQSQPDAHGARNTTRQRNVSCNQFFLFRQFFFTRLMLFYWKSNLIHYRERVGSSHHQTWRLVNINSINSR